VFSVSQGSAEPLIRRGGKIECFDC